MLDVLLLLSAPISAFVLGVYVGTRGARQYMLRKIQRRIDYIDRNNLQGRHGRYARGFYHALTVARKDVYRPIGEICKGAEVDPTNLES